MSETYRVLNNKGYAYFEWGPIWSSHRGHHAHDDVINGMANQLSIKVNYTNDGTTIPDWSHLYLTDVEMKGVLSTKIKNEKLLDMIIYFIYKWDGLNRNTWNQVKRAFFLQTWKIKIWNIQITEKPPLNILSTLQKTYYIKESFIEKEGQIVVKNYNEYI